MVGAAGQDSSEFEKCAIKIKFIQSNLFNQIYFLAPLTTLVPTARPAPVRDTGPGGKIHLELGFGAWMADQGEHCSVPPS